MSAKPSMGKCQLCGGTFSRVSMSRHLSGCGLPPPATAGGRKAGHSLVVFVEGRYAKDYWMHVAVPEAASLHTLDDFLRRTWLECCGHMSAFTIAGERYASQAMDEFDRKGMGGRLSRVLEVGDRFYHEYDFGSTTELVLKVVGRRDSDKPRGAVQLLSRNAAPQVTCQKCAAGPATQICSECAWNDEGWLCEPCAEEHECGMEMCLPVVNSPRVGVCGYTG